MRSHQLLVVASVTDQVGDGDDGQLVLAANCFELGQPGHVGLVGGHDLAQHARGVLARQATQVDGRLGVAGALQDATRAVAQREDVTRVG